VNRLRQAVETSRATYLQADDATIWNSIDGSHCIGYVLSGGCFTVFKCRGRLESFPKELGSFHVDDSIAAIFYLLLDITV